MFDPRLTEEYQVAGEPWSKQTADGEMLAMAIGAALWGTSNVASERGPHGHEDAPHRRPLRLREPEVEPARVRCFRRQAARA